MSRIENTKVYGLAESVAASGYPMSIEVINREGNIKDYERANKLANTPIGSGHDQFLTSIIVQFDLTFPIKAWTELQRYHLVDFCSSMSTMHRVTKMDIDDACNKYVDSKIKDILNN